MTERPEAWTPAGAWTLRRNARLLAAQRGLVVKVVALALIAGVLGLFAWWLALVVLLLTGPMIALGIGRAQYEFEQRSGGKALGEQ